MSLSPGLLQPICVNFRQFALFSVIFGLFSRYSHVILTLFCVNLLSGGRYFVLICVILGHKKASIVLHLTLQPK